ncbi:MAG TPA: hypothetical protein VD948_01940, partial [Rhodothermales bacterium]|nr:hypothetical protein [Rhodothermales bacterium]
ADAALFGRLYGFEERGNFEDEATRQRTGENVLHPASPIEDQAPAGEAPEAFAARVAALRARLFEARSRRPRPLRDDKVLADWNGHAASALLRAGLALGAPAMIEAGRAALDFVLTRMRTDDGALLHRFHGEAAGITAFADDYAFVVRALLDAFEVEGDPAHLGTALDLMQRLIDGHWDEDAGLFRLAGRGATDLVAAPAERHDGAMPSGNAVACLNLLHLARLTGDVEMDRRARRMLEAASAEIASHPAGYAAWLMALDEVVYGAGEVVVAGAGPEAEAMLTEARAVRLPGTLVVPLRPDAQADLARVSPPLGAFTVPPQGALAYVCRDFRCEAPVSDVEALRASLAASA